MKTLTDSYKSHGGKRVGRLEVKRLWKQVASVVKQCNRTGESTVMKEYLAE